MKHVFSNSSEVAHVWASRTQIEGRCSNVYFEGGTIFSYGPHFPMARFLPDGSVAITTKKSSVTTNKHLSQVRYAVHHLARIHVSNIMDEPSSQVAAVRKEIHRLLFQAAEARMTVTKQKYRATAVCVAEQFNLYAKAHKSRVKINVEKIAGADLVNLKEILAKQDDLEARRKAKADAKRAKENAERDANTIATWRADGPYYISLNRHPVMLRVGVEGAGPDVIETSHGAEIPVDSAKQLWPIIQRVMRGAKDYEFGMELGRYRLTMIRRDGSIKVGCHEIAFSEIESIALKLGLIEQATKIPVWHLT